MDKEEILYFVWMYAGASLGCLAIPRLAGGLI